MRGADAGESLGERLRLFTHIDARILTYVDRLDARAFAPQAGPSARERRARTYSSRRGAAQVNDTSKNGLYDSRYILCRPFGDGAKPNRSFRS